MILYQSGERFFINWVADIVVYYITPNLSLARFIGIAWVWVIPMGWLCRAQLRCALHWQMFVCLVHFQWHSSDVFWVHVRPLLLCE